MARAAAGLADEVRQQLMVGEPVGVGTVLLLVGSGNNGADALWAGAELATGGARVAIIQTSDRVDRPALDAAIAAGATVQDSGRAAELASTSSVIVDGILGTGASAHPGLRGEAREIVLAVLGALGAARVVAVDLPSGIGVDDGTVPDAIVLPAQVTVTFGGYKAGLFIAPGSTLAGRVRLIDIGLTADLELLEPVLSVAALGELA